MLWTLTFCIFSKQTIMDRLHSFIALQLFFKTNFQTSLQLYFTPIIQNKLPNIDQRYLSALSEREHFNVNLLSCQLLFSRYLIFEENYYLFFFSLVQKGCRACVWEFSSILWTLRFCNFSKTKYNGQTVQLFYTSIQLHFIYYSK